MSAAAPTRHAPLALWRIAQTFLHTLFSLFGNPEDIAAQHTLTTKAHTHLVHWLRAAEAILRKLLLIEAAALKRPNAVPPASSRQNRPRTRRLIEFFAEKPEDWRVSFRMFSEERRLPAGKRCLTVRKSGPVEAPVCRLEAGAPRSFHSAWPLAERYEALIRVFNNPAPYASRLARRLHTRPRAAHAILRDPEHFASKLDPVARAELERADEPAARTFNNSS